MVSSEEAHVPAIWKVFVCGLITCVLVAACGPAVIVAVILPPDRKPRTSETIVIAEPVLVVSVPNPATSTSEPDRPWSLLPVTVTVRNPNNERVPPLTIELSLAYTANGSPQRTMTLTAPVPMIADLASQATTSRTVPRGVDLGRTDGGASRGSRAVTFDSTPMAMACLTSRPAVLCIGPRPGASTSWWDLSPSRARGSRSTCRVRSSIRPVVERARGRAI